jgi:hypothetical protein
MMKSHPAKIIQKPPLYRQTNIARQTNRQTDRHRFTQISPDSAYSTQDQPKTEAPSLANSTPLLNGHQ